MKTRQKEDDKKAITRQKEDDKKAITRQEQDDKRKTEEYLFAKMRYKPFCSLVVWICENIKDEYDVIFISTLRKQLKMPYQTAYRHLTDLNYQGLLEIGSRVGNFLSFKGAFNKKRLKLKKYYKIAKQRLNDLS